MNGLNRNESTSTAGHFYQRSIERDKQEVNTMSKLIGLSVAGEIVGKGLHEAEKLLVEAGLSPAEAATVAFTHLGARSRVIHGTANEITATILYVCCESVSLGLR